MKSTSAYKALIVDLILFLLFGTITWAINVFGQSIFPGNNLFPFLIRSVILLLLLALSYYVNYRFCRKNELSQNLLKFKFRFLKNYLIGVIVGCLLIAVIWSITYLVYPFNIIRNGNSNINPFTEIISYCLGNTLEELLFRVFLLLAFIKLFGKTGAVLSVSLLFGIFHLQGTGFTREGLSMLITTFTMSLLFISVIYYTRSIWAAVTLHITGNVLLHIIGFDGGNMGIFQIKFTGANTNGYFITLIYEIVVMAFAFILYFRGKSKYKNCY